MDEQAKHHQEQMNEQATKSRVQPRQYRIPRNFPMVANFRENPISRGFKFSRFAQQYSLVFDHAPYSYWYDTPLAQDTVPRVCVKKMMADQASIRETCSP